jgi:P-aminobenzoate N-oxygenase AurF
MLDLDYTYASCVRNSEKVTWKLDDVMPEGTRLDFSRPFLPAALAGRGDLGFLSADEARKLNQITGNAYLNLFAFVEEYIIALAVQHAQAEMFGDHDAIRALVRFADEEVKHQAMFHRYCDAFSRDFGHPCDVLGSAAEVAGVILSKSPIAVMLVTLHLEIMTQAHYVECVKDDTRIDPFFAKLLKFHWLEESQHARIDALELDKLLATATPAAIAKSFDEYLGLIDAFDGLLKSQSEMDARAIATACGRSFSAEESAKIMAAQHKGYRHTFLVYGMTNPTFLEDVAKISPDAAPRVSHKAEELS